MKKILFLRLFGMFSFLFSDTLFAQSKNIAEAQHLWLVYTGNHMIAKKWALHTEYQWRRSEFGNNWQQSLLRIGADYHINPNLSLTTGYGWIQSFPYGKQPIAYTFNEHRIWQQLVLTQDFGRFYFHHRYRLEQRFLEQKMRSADEWFTDKYAFRNRGRYRLQVSIPISTKRMSDGTFFASFYDEVFLGFGQGIGKNILDQNRLYGGVGWRIDKNFNLQTGYLNHYIIKADGLSHERNHTWQLALQYNFDLTKS